MRWGQRWAGSCDRAAECACDVTPSQAITCPHRSRALGYGRRRRGGCTAACTAEWCETCRAPESPDRGSEVAEPHRLQAGAPLANRHAELEGGEDEGGCTSDLGVAAGGWVVFEDEARVHVDGERIADSEGQVAEKVNGYKQERGQQRQRHLRYMDSQNASKWQLIDGSALSCVRKIN